MWKTDLSRPSSATTSAQLLEIVNFLVDNNQYWVLADIAAAILPHMEERQDAYQRAYNLSVRCGEPCKALHQKAQELAEVVSFLSKRAKGDVIVR